MKKYGRFLTLVHKQPIEKLKINFIHTILNLDLHYNICNIVCPLIFYYTSLSADFLCILSNFLC